MNKKKILPLVLVTILLVFAYIAKTSFFKNKFSYAGTVEVIKVDIPARISSVISEMPVVEGEKINKGQLLVKLACEDIQIAFNLARSNFERSKKLYNGGSISQESFDLVRNKKEDAELKKNWCQISSPLNGTVLVKYYEPGEMVVPGVKLLSIADLNEVYAYFYLPHDEISKLKLHEKVKALVPEFDNKEFDGLITYINPEAEFTPKNVQTREERTRLVYAVKVQFQNPEGILKPGMTLEWPARD